MKMIIKSQSTVTNTSSDDIIQLVKFFCRQLLHILHSTLFTTPFHEHYSPSLKLINNIVFMILDSSFVAFLGNITGKKRIFATTHNQFPLIKIIIKLMQFHLKQLCTDTRIINLHLTTIPFTSSNTINNVIDIIHKR